MPVTKVGVVIFLGETASGKTELITRIISANHDFQASYHPTVFPTYFDHITQNKVVGIWEMPGDPKHIPLYPGYMTNADVALFCVDLTTNQLDDKYTIETIKLFQKINGPDSPIVLVGTKSDSPEAKLDKLEDMMALGWFHSSIVTSVKEGRQITEICSVILKICEEKHERSAKKDEMETISLPEKPADEHQKLIKRSPSYDPFLRKHSTSNGNSSSGCCQCNIM